MKHWIERLFCRMGIHYYGSWFKEDKGAFEVKAVDIYNRSITVGKCVTLCTRCFRPRQ